jgi:hypothetical protein
LSVAIVFHPILALWGGVGSQRRLFASPLVRLHSVPGCISSRTAKGVIVILSNRVTLPAIV